MARNAGYILWVGLALLVVAALGAGAWAAEARFLQRGLVAGFPEHVADTPGADGAFVSRLCVNAPLDAYDAEQLTWALGRIEDLGAAWVRVHIRWADVEAVEGVRSWDAVDRMVAGVVARGLGMVVVLDSAPEWDGAPPDPAAFADFAGDVAARYADAITYYQIWHNPNLGDSWGGAANPFGYADLLARAAQTIRGADPGARIVLGSLAPTVERGERNYAEDVFLEMLYAAGAAPYFDVVAAQPYGFETGPEDRRVDPAVLNFSRAILVRESLVAHGEGHKAVWATNFGWNSMRADLPGLASIWGEVDETAQAQFTVGALERAEQEWPWMGLMCVNGLQPRPEGASGARASVPDARESWGFAMIDPEGEPRPVYGAVQSWARRPAAATTGAYRADTDLAVFEGSWSLGPQGADIGEFGDHRVTLAFEGTGVALTVRRGPYRAFLYVMVDGEPAPALPRDREGRAYVVLYDPLAAVATVPLAEGLAAGRHTVTVEAERGWGQWALADWRVTTAPAHVARTRSGFVVWGLIAAVGLVAVGWAAPRVAWGRWKDRALGAWAGMAAWVRLAVSVGASAVTLFAAWQTLVGGSLFRRLGDQGEILVLALATGVFRYSPWVLLSLGAGLVMAAIVFVDPSLGLALTMVAAPLYLHPMSLFGKSFSLAELVLLPTLLGWAVRWAAEMARGRHHRRMALGPAARALGWPVLALVGWSVASALGAQHGREALRELRLVILEPALFFAALVTLSMSNRERWRVVDAFVVSAVGVALVGLVQYFVLGDVITAEGGVLRLRSIYGSPNNVGLMMGRVLPVLLAIVVWGGPARSRGQRARRWVYGLAVLPVALALGLSLSRGAIVLGVPAAVVALGLLAGRRWRTATLIAVGLGLLALIPLLRLPRFAGLVDLSQGTTSFRVALWHSSIEMVGDHPLLGVGPDNFLYAYRTRYVLPTAWEEFNLSHPHNVVLDFAARLGLPGLAIFLWLQMVFWRRAVPLRTLDDKGRRALALGAMASMANFLGHGLVDAAYFVIDLAFVFMLTLATVAWLADRAPERPS